MMGLSMTKWSERERGMPWSKQSTIIKVRKGREREVKTKSTFFHPNTDIPLVNLGKTSGRRLSDTAGETPLNSTEASGEHPNRRQGGFALREIKKHFTF